MASEQENANEATAKAVAEATRVAIQAMAAGAMERPQSAGPNVTCKGIWVIQGLNC